MQRAFELALRPPRHRAFGFVLQPLTIGHLLLLDEVESPVARLQASSGSDIALAAFICSEPHAKSKELIESPWMQLFWWWHGRRCRKLDAKAECDAFAKYLEDSLAAPDIIRQRKAAAEPPPMESPWALVIVSSLMSDLGMSYQDAISIPLVRAKALIVALRESRREIKLSGGDDNEWFDFVRKVDTGEVPWED